MSEDFPVLAGFRAGSLLAGYRLEAQVGAGGMATVFRARDERLGRLVALKILTPGLAADRDFRRRFIAESRAAALVDDPHIIPVYEAGEAGGVLFIAMRFVGGGDLRDVLDREGPLPPGRAAGFLSPVASALDAAHAAGLVHRDVKPANILVDARPGRPDHVYLSDFGVSKGAASSVSLTTAGQFLGTPGYSAPEQIQGRTVDGRADQYALACVAYQLLSGAAPFERDQGMAVLFAHLSEPPPPLASRRPDLPAAIDRVLTRALAKTPEKRYGSCREFTDALREALGVPPYDSDGPVAAPGHQPAEPIGAAGFPVMPAAETGNAAVPAGLAAAVTRDPRADGPRVGAPDGPVWEPSLGADPGRGRARRIRHPRRFVVAGLAALLVLVITGAFISWQWSQNQYYAGTNGRGELVIYRGINEVVAGISLSRPYQQTGIPLDQVPVPYQQLVKDADAAGSLSQVHTVVANISAAVGMCREQYDALRAWVSAENSYQAAVARAQRQHKATNGIPGPGPEPAKAGAQCAPSTAFGIPASALVPTAT